MAADVIVFQRPLVVAVMHHATPIVAAKLPPVTTVAMIVAVSHVRVCVWFAFAKKFAALNVFAPPIAVVAQQRNASAFVSAFRAFDWLALKFHAVADAMTVAIHARHRVVATKQNIPFEKTRPEHEAGFFVRPLEALLEVIIMGAKRIRSDVAETTCVRR